MPEWLAPLAGLGDEWERVLLGLGVVLILTGRIVPKFRLDEARQDRDAWKTAYEGEHDARLIAEADQGQRARNADLMVQLLNRLTAPLARSEEARDASS